MNRLNRIYGLECRHYLHELIGSIVWSPVTRKHRRSVCCDDMYANQHEFNALPQFSVKTQSPYRTLGLKTAIGIHPQYD
ncbi:MAG: hypothetical protein U9Q91_05095 [Candidatus Marinimicrobia bacterium]|nr:hypothetical protein [Candidatus Neomarinimicrobiota bacterium]